MTEKNGRHPVEVVAEVKSMELDLDHNGVYKLQLEDGSTILADFTASQWGSLEGMHSRGKYSVKLVGEGDYAGGQLTRIACIDLKKTHRIVPPADPEEPTLWHKIDQISKSVDWSDVPIDGAKNLHHYLYGRPKVDD